MANPTIKTQEKILATIKRSKTSLSITEIARLSKTGFYEAKQTIGFFNELGMLELTISSGNVTLVKYKGEKNGTN